MAANKVFIVEDDAVIARAVAAHLTTWQMQVQCAGNFEKITEEVEDFQPDIIIMDIKLPYYNGFYWCAEIRKTSKVPIVFLSSADDNMNIVMAMNMGGDEFIEKPFDLNVVTAKVQAVLRRAYSFQGSANVLEHKGIVLNLSDATLSYEGEKLELTKNEFRILQTLMEYKGKIVPRDEIIEKLWESDQFIDDNTLTVNVARLRKKLDIIGMGDMIRTKKGIGYIVE